jgi:hypothetical protein
MSNLEKLEVWKKRHSLGWPRRSDEDVDHVRQAFMQSLNTSISWVSAQLQILQTTVHRIFWNSLCLKLYKLQVVQRLTACDKQQRLWFSIYMYAQILEHDSF